MTQPGDVPQFKNTEDALCYGASIRARAKDDPARLYMLGALRQERARLVQQVRELMDAGKESEALFLASGQSQLCREALEAAEGVN